MMQELLARLVAHRRIVSIFLVAVIALAVGYGVLVSRAPRALARQPQPGVCDLGPRRRDAPTPRRPRPRPATRPQAPRAHDGPRSRRETSPSGRFGRRGSDRTEADGSFTLTKPSGTVIVKLPGRRRR
jgi:hypothetical protein